MRSKVKSVFPECLFFLLRPKDTNNRTFIKHFCCSHISLVMLLHRNWCLFQLWFSYTMHEQWAGQGAAAASPNTQHKLPGFERQSSCFKKNNPTEASFVPLFLITKEHSLYHAKTQDKQGISSVNEQQIKTSIHKTHPCLALGCLFPAGLGPIWVTGDGNQVAIWLALMLVLLSWRAVLQQKQMQAVWTVTTHRGTQAINSASCKTIISPPHPKAKGGARLK